jgi:hypothetical protein
MMLGLLCL